MQPGVEMENLINELEVLVSESKTPLTGGGSKKIVEAQDIYAILDEMRRVFPREFDIARRILKEEADTLECAKMQADAIIADAQQQAVILAGDQEIVRLAMQQADQVREDACEDACQNDREHGVQRELDQAAPAPPPEWSGRRRCRHPPA